MTNTILEEKERILNFTNDIELESIVIDKENYFKIFCILLSTRKIAISSHFRISVYLIFNLTRFENAFFSKNRFNQIRRSDVESRIQNFYFSADFRQFLNFNFK